MHAHRLVSEFICEDRRQEVLTRVLLHEVESPRPVHRAVHDVVDDRSRDDVCNTVVLFDHVCHRHAGDRAYIVRLATVCGIQRRAVELYAPTFVGAVHNPSVEGGEVCVRIVQSLGHVSWTVPVDRQRTHRNRAPNAIAMRRVTDPCRCLLQRIRRQRSHTPPTFTGNSFSHSSHSVLKIDFRNIGTGSGSKMLRSRARDSGVRVAGRLAVPHLDCHRSQSSRTNHACAPAKSKMRTSPAPKRKWVDSSCDVEGLSVRSMSPSTR